MMEPDMFPIVRHIRHLAGLPAQDHRNDQELLNCFIRGQDRTAMEALVYRHAGLVRGVCQRMLGGGSDADDAFQATFLILLRNASSIRRPQSISSWLYGVAVRVAQRAKTKGRATRPLTGEVATGPGADPSNRAELNDLCAVVDTEVALLAEKYRGPILAYYFHGLTREQAATQLGLTTRTLARRLETARHLLQARFQQRGLVLSAALLAGCLAEGAAQGAATLALVTRTTEMALRWLAGTVPSQVLRLVQGVSFELTAGTVKRAVLIASFACLLGGGYLVARQVWTTTSVISSETGRANAPPVSRPTPPKAVATKTRSDLYGDPLPPGALARLGTVRFRHPGYILHMAFSPDGTTLATLGNNSVCLWDWASGKEFGRIEAPFLNALAFSPDGNLLATATGLRAIRLWDLKNLKQVGTLRARPPSYMDSRAALAFTEGGRLITYAGDEGVVQSWDVKTRTPRRSFRLSKKGDMVSALAIAPEGNVLAYATRYVKDMNAGPVCLVDSATGKELQCLRDHKQSVWSLAFSPDGKVLASASTTESPILWNVTTAKPLWKPTGEETRAEFLAFSPDGHQLASGDLWLPVRLWDVATGKPRKEFESELVGSQCLAFSQDGKRVAVSDGNTVQRLDVSSGKQIGPLAEPTSPIHSVAWRPDGKTVALGTETGVWLRAAASGKPLGKLWRGQKTPPDPLNHFGMSPDGRYFALARGASVELFDTTSRKLLHSFTPSIATIHDFVFSADSKTVAADVGFGVVFGWDCATGTKRFTLQGKHGSRLVALSPDGTMIATAYDSPSGDVSGIHLWDQSSGKRIRDLPINNAWIHALAFSPNSKSLATLTVSQSAEQGGLIVWDVRAGKRRFRLPKVDAIAMAYSPDGTFLACEGPANAVCLLSASTGKTSRCFRGHQARINALAFSPDGEMLVSGSEDATALVWDIGALKRR